MSLRLAKHIGFKGFAFIVLGLMFILLGAANFGGPPPSDLQRENMAVLIRLMPIEGWYISWIVAGISALVAAFVIKVEPYAAAVTSSLPFTFSIGYFFASLLGLGYRAWAAGLIYLMVAALVAIVAVWPDPLRVKIDDKIIKL